MQLANYKFYCNRAEEGEIIESILYFYSILGWAGEGCGDANPGTNGSGEAVSLFSLKIG